MFRLANLFDLGQQICKVFDVATFYATGMSVWAPPPGLLVSPQPDRAPGERPELLPQPSDATKHWYYYGCLACDEIRVNKLVVASLCTPEELAQEPYKSTLSRVRNCSDYKAYSSKLEEQLHRVRGERRFITGKLKKTQTTPFVLQKEVAALGATLLEARRSQERAVCEKCRGATERGSLPSCRSMCGFSVRKTRWVGRRFGGGGGP
ncbi:hypothetical protein B0H14DRAFT_2617833 [Mycena olivaceomarginata]|nr:hypothetical protein B0H14DRAFT_2617833 [Mycena olivaceomarginata]